MRWVDEALNKERDQFDGRERLIVVQGNRLILWAIMDYLNLNRLSVTDFKLPFTEDKVAELVSIAAQRLIEIVLENYPDAYPQPLFKNQSKCELLGTNLSYWLKALTK